MEPEEYGGYLIKSNGANMRCIKAIGKGSVPDVLKGLYTSVQEARKAIDIQANKNKVKTYGKAKSST